MRRPREALWVVATCVLGEDSSRERGPAPKAEDLLRQAAWRPPSPAPSCGGGTHSPQTHRQKQGARGLQCSEAPSPARLWDSSREGAATGNPQP